MIKISECDVSRATHNMAARSGLVPDQDGCVRVL